MPKDNIPLFAFNRGLISPLALARTDLKRTALSAEEMTNWMPRTLGSMMLRPGLKYVGSTLDDAEAIHIPFVFSIDDTAIIELTDEAMRVRVGETLITRVSVSTAVTNGTFGSDVSSWTDNDESGATSVWATGGYMSLTGTRYNAAIRRQQVTVAVGDRNKEHALHIVIERGPVTLKVGSSSGGDQYIAETELGTGVHSLAFTPTNDFHIEFSNRRLAASLVDSVAVEAAGDMVVETPWTADDLQNVRWAQSGDVVFVACDGIQQRKIERRAARSWSVVLYEPEDGPFRSLNTTTVRLTPSAVRGDITLTASRSFFSSNHVGALFRITSVGQLVGANLNGADQYTGSVRVTGAGSSVRQFSITITGTWSGTLTLQRSVGEEGAWTDVTTYTANTAISYNDGLDNQIIYYRIGFKAGNYTSGTAAISLEYNSGGITGVLRVTAYSSATSVSAAVIEELGGLSGSEDWSEGAWSDYRGWPSAVALHEGRLWWAGKDKVWGSVSDAYDSFDDETEGDSGPISRTIGTGPIDTINWLLPLQRLVAGGQAREYVARSSGFDEPLTPTNFNIKEPSTQGSAAVAAVQIDTFGVFVHRSGTKLYLLEFSQDVNVNDYVSGDLTVLVPDLFTNRAEFDASRIIRIAVQRQPDTRIHCVRADGKVSVLVFDAAEDVKCWVQVETGSVGLPHEDGVIDAFVLPGDVEDYVYYLVRRDIDNDTKHYLERWAYEQECTGQPANKNVDSHVEYFGAATTTITGLGHLAGMEVVAWGANVDLGDIDGTETGEDLGTYTVSGGGSITLTQSVTWAVVGLAYEARFKSAKLAYAAGGSTALTQRKRVGQIGLILANTHAQGLEYGQDFDTMDGIPLVQEGAAVDEDHIYEHLDMDMTAFPGGWTPDSRLCLKAESPRPATVCAAVLDIETNG